MKKIDLSVLIDEPAEEYHAKSGVDYLSSHLLIEFMKCPLSYHRKINGEMPDQDSTAFLVGRAAHVRILEGRKRFEEEFAVGGPINAKTGKPFGQGTKAFAAWAAEVGKPVLTEDQAALIEDMAAGVVMNDAAIALLEEGRGEGVGRAVYCGEPCQIRVDWLNPEHGIVDLKTCDDVTWFEADARRFRYQHQLAFYQAVLCELVGWLVPVWVIAVEKKPPFRCGTWLVSDDALTIARQENEAAIRRLRECAETGTWPTGFEDVRTLELL